MTDSGCSCVRFDQGDDSDRLALQLKALGHPARIEIIRRLGERDCCCGEFCDALSLAQSTISQHLDLLRRAGLVDCRSQGTRSRYRLNRETFQALAQAVAAVGARPASSGDDDR